MASRLEWIVMLLLMLGSLLLSITVTPAPSEAQTIVGDPLAADATPVAEARDSASPERNWLPSLDAFDTAGFGLLPDLAPRFAPDQP